MSIGALNARESLFNKLSCVRCLLCFMGYLAVIRYMFGRLPYNGVKLIFGNPCLQPFWYSPGTAGCLPRFRGYELTTDEKSG